MKNTVRWRVWSINMVIFKAVCRWIHPKNSAGVKMKLNFDRYTWTQLWNLFFPTRCCRHVILIFCSSFFTFIHSESVKIFMTFSWYWVAAPSAQPTSSHDWLFHLHLLLCDCFTFDIENQWWAFTLIRFISLFYESLYIQRRHTRKKIKLQ